MVDSGAQSSVISITLAQQLGLVNRIDRTQRGIASGVGKANIVGRINNVICTLGAGHVEFQLMLNSAMCTIVRTVCKTWRWGSHGAPTLEILNLFSDEE